MMETHEQFNAWLAGSDGAYIKYQVGKERYTMIRVHENEDFDYLYCRQSAMSGRMERSMRFDYAGIYCKRDGLIYDAQSEIKMPFKFSKGMRSRGMGQILARVNAGVCAAVESTIANDRKNLRVTELESAEQMDRIKDYKNYRAASVARSLFLQGHTGEFLFQCKYERGGLSDDELLAYILDPVRFIATEAVSYIDSYQFDILRELMRNESLKEAYRMIAENPRHPAQYVKRIIQAVSAIAAKTVRVTILKNDLEFAFDAKSNVLRKDCDGNYDTYHIAHSDRQEFIRRFGYDGYAPIDILRIEYNGVSIYDAEEAP